MSHLKQWLIKQTASNYYFHSSRMPTPQFHDDYFSRSRLKYVLSTPRGSWSFAAGSMIATRLEEVSSARKCVPTSSALLSTRSPKGLLAYCTPRQSGVHF